MTAKMKTYPNHDDIIVDIDLIGTRYENDGYKEIIALKFQCGVWIKHEITFDLKTATSLVEALTRSINHHETRMIPIR